MPTLVVHGERDVVIPLSIAEMVAATIPRSELVVLPGAGHLPTTTRPALLVDAIEQWAATL